MDYYTRRRFLQKAAKTVSSGIAAPLLIGGCQSAGSGKCRVPSYLKGYESLYRHDPRAAAIQWFRDARFGLFIHYGLYSLLGRGEWVQYHQKIRIAEYARLKDQFKADKFDADFIADLAMAAEMKYITLVAKHCDSFCLWDTKYTDFNSVNSPCGRDLVAEMANACRKKGLGFFIFYEHGFDWRHPHGPSPEDWSMKAVRPHYDPPETYYASDADYDFQNYRDYVTGQITELLTHYGKVAGIWLDGIAVPKSGDPSKFKLDELYALIRRLQPQTLISYKSGATGTEDFYAPEKSQIDWVTERNDKPMEVCITLQKTEHLAGKYGFHIADWGYAEGARHIGPQAVLEELAKARQMNANLLLNTGPLPDGLIHPEDIKTLRAVGKTIRQSGWPG